MLWVTRSHVHVDRVACPWLITRFIDSDAEFLFVPKSEIDRVVKETGGIPFDAPGVELGHHENRCSFESIVLKYELKEPGLLRLAKIIHWTPRIAAILHSPRSRFFQTSIRTTCPSMFPRKMFELIFSNHPERVVKMSKRI